MIHRDWHASKGIALCLSLVVGMSLGSCLGGKDAHSDKENVSLARVELVDPMIGTDWVGNTYPGVSSPFGMVQLSPDNGLPGWDRISGYYYPDSTIAGFSHTHLSGTGAGDMYDVSFMPVLLPALEEKAPLGIHAKFSHAGEKAQAGYYSVLLQPYQIKVELTSTPHVGIQSYTFEKASDSACIILDLSKSMNWDRAWSSDIRLLEDGTIVGHRYSDGWARDQKVYFASKFSRQPDRLEIDSIPLYGNTDKKLAGYGYKARLHYKVQAGEQILVSTALSGVDERGALFNLEAEATEASFDAYRKRAQADWGSRLDAIEVEGGSLAENRIFYTALYHSMLCPTLYSDVDGRYLGPDRKVYQLENGAKRYSTFSLWDTYRSAHPLYNIIAPADNRDMVQSLVDFARQNQGRMPVWNMWASETDMMIGFHSIPVIVEAILKGVYTPAPEERQALLDMMLSNYRRKGYRSVDVFARLGFVPEEQEEESVSKTLEYAYDAGALLRWARAMDSTSVQTEELQKLSQGYRAVWDGESGFFRPRRADGSFVSPFDPFAYSKAYTESNAYQYLMGVQHDVEGMIELMGGRDKFAQRLDEFFGTDTPKHIELPIFSTGMIGQYAHGNEPGHHVPFLYNKVGRPWQTAKLIEGIRSQLYTDKPDGLCGNEDCGQMSAWYVFAAMGLYPIDPTNLEYEIFTPLFSRTNIRLGNGNSFEIVMNKSSAEHIYIKSVSLNGAPLVRSYITHEELMAGGRLEIETTKEAGVCWY